MQQHQIAANTAPRLFEALRTHLELSRRHRYERSIRLFRRQICGSLGLDANGPAGEPLDCALYLFAFAEPYRFPVGMAEFFFHDDGPAYCASTLCESEVTAFPGERICMRSLLIAEEFQKSALSLHLGATLADIASSLGARYMTASAGVDHEYLMRLHRNLGMRRLGTFSSDNVTLQRSVLPLEELALRAQMLRRNRPPMFGAELVEEVRMTRLHGGLLASNYAPLPAGVV